MAVRTEATQNFQVRKVLAGVWAVLFRVGAYLAVTEASLTGKGRSTGMWRCGVCVSKLVARASAVLVPIGGPVLIPKGTGRKWHLPFSFFPEGCP